MPVNKNLIPGGEELTDKMAIFVREYIIDFNSTRAAKEAGYASPSSNGSALLKKPQVRRAVAKLIAPLLEDQKLTAQRVLSQLENFLFRDIADFIDAEGYLVGSLRDLPPRLRQCIDDFEVVKEYDEETGRLVRERVKVKLVGKMPAMNAALKYLGLTQPDTVVNVGIGQSPFNWVDYIKPPPTQNEVDLKLLEVEGEVV